MKSNKAIAFRPVVWITGASRGIGKELAKQFASIGCKVALSARSEKELLKLEKEIISLGGITKSFPCDVANEKSLLQTHKNIQKELGEVEVLINNAGVTVFKSIEKTSVKEFNDILSVNLRGMFLCVKAVLPSMKKKNNGWIFNILSTASTTTFKNSGAYSASKAGAMMLGKVLREELREKNIRVVNVFPGATETAMWSKEERKKYSFRMMSAKSVAEVVLQTYRFPSDVICEEIVLRPMLGDI
ncbi:MAG: SDR family oxidoreductase [Ignavibacteriales bacterium]|nr:SDR family oxidoreductase [Ignavibacteriales bacterium]